MNESMVYGVCVIRVDMDHPLYTYYSDNREDAKKCLDSIREEWVKAVENKVPFKMPDPYMAYFTPNLIKEIRVDEMPYEQYQRMNSSFGSELREKGTSGVMNKMFKNI